MPSPDALLKYTALQRAEHWGHGAVLFMGLLLVLFVVFIVLCPIGCILLVAVVVLVLLFLKIDVLVIYDIMGRRRRT